MIVGFDIPRQVYCTGGRFNTQGAADTPDTQIATFTYVNDLVVTFISEDQGLRFEELHVFPADNKLPHTGISLERFTGHHAINVPWGLFSTGAKGPDCFGRGIHHRVYAVQLRRESETR